nr:reverse transcriptase domain-containing protein [Tanacetum cinerariifolium]
MFNTTLTGNARVWFDDLLAESIDSYDDMKKAFLENYLQRKKLGVRKLQAVPPTAHEMLKIPMEEGIIILKSSRKKSDFHWTAEVEEAFMKMKQLIAELSMLTAPMEKEELIVYMAASKKRRGLSGYSDGIGRRAPRTMDFVYG